MKPWELKCPDAEVEPGAKSLAVFKSIADRFRRDRHFWSALGRRQKRVHQFCLKGAEHEECFVFIDENGGQILAGRFPRPDTVWTSDEEAFTNILTGVAGREVIEAGRVRLLGDAALLAELWEGLEGR